MGFDQGHRTGRTTSPRVVAVGAQESSPVCRCKGMARSQRQFGAAAAIVALTALATIIVLAPPPAEAATQDLPLVFPVVGEVHYTDTFGACRSGCSRHHEGNDLMSAKMTPVVAAANGVIVYVNWSSDPGNLNPDRCCTIALRHDDGWESWYIHLNNDTPGTDDGAGWGIAEGIVPGTRVSAGQLIGWVGDSGNAENVGSHLHFEYHQPDGTPVNPNPYLLAAVPVELLDAQFAVDFGSFQAVSAPQGGTLNIQADTFVNWTVQVRQGSGQVVWTHNGSGTEAVWWEGSTEPGIHDVLVDCGPYGVLSDTARVGTYQGTFVDDDGSYAEAQIEQMAARGITVGCTWNSYCPGVTITRAQAATMIARAVGGEQSYPSYQAHFDDVSSDAWFVGSVEYLVEIGALPAGRTFDGGSPGARGFLVSTLMDALGRTDYPQHQGYFTDIGPDHPLAGKIELAHELGIALGHKDGTFGAQETLTREQAAAFLMRGL